MPRQLRGFCNKIAKYSLTLSLSLSLSLARCNMAKAAQQDHYAESGCALLFGCSRANGDLLSCGRKMRGEIFLDGQRRARKSRTKRARGMSVSGVSPTSWLGGGDNWPLARAPSLKTTTLAEDKKAIRAGSIVAVEFCASGFRLIGANSRKCNLLLAVRGTQAEQSLAAPRLD